MLALVDVEEKPSDGIIIPDTVKEKPWEDNIRHGEGCKEGVITVAEAKGMGPELEIVERMKFDFPSRTPPWSPR